MGLIESFKDFVIKKFNVELLDEELEYCISKELSSSVVHIIFQAFKFKLNVEYNALARIWFLTDKNEYLYKYKPQIQEKIDDLHQSQIKEFEEYCRQNDIEYYDTSGAVVKEKEIDGKRFLEVQIVFKYLE